MTPLDPALDYAAHGRPVFPCNPEAGRFHKRPLTENGFYDASSDSAIVRAWWSRWPRALIGIPTGEAIGAVVLDIDVKRPEANGYDTLDDLGFAILPECDGAYRLRRVAPVFRDPARRVAEHRRRARARNWTRPRLAWRWRLCDRAITR